MAICGITLDEGLTFEEKEHIYRLNGVIIPSVTTIMQPLSGKVYGGVDPVKMRAAASRGTVIHDAIEVYNKYNIRDIPSEYEPFLQAYVDWKDEHTVTVLGSEIRTYHKSELYAGTVDSLCRVDGKLYLLDFKAVAMIDERHQRMYGVQLEAYSQALRSHGLAIEGKRILHLKKDGTWTEYEYPVRDLASLNIFRACRQIYNF
jgi:hypothetical protein